jgi:hypothetical protein
MDCAAVCQAVKRFAERLERDRKLCQQVRELENKLHNVEC